MTAGEEFLSRQADEEEVADVEELPLAELEQQARENAKDERTEGGFEAEKIEATESPRIENGELKPIDQR